MTRDHLVNNRVAAHARHRLEKDYPNQNRGESCSRRKYEPRRESWPGRRCFATQGRAHVPAQMCGRAIRGRTAGQRTAQFANRSFSSATIRATLEMPLGFTRVRQIEFAVHIGVE